MALHDDHNGDRPADILEQAAPAFLQLLDSDPEQGFAEFYRLARALLTVSPPRVMWQVPADKREDQIHDTAPKGSHCPYHVGFFFFRGIHLSFL